jgi:hypothetical protein
MSPNAFATGALPLSLLIGCGSGAGGAVAADAGVDVQVITAQEGHACLADPGDGIELVCSRAQGLVCIATYSRQITRPDGGIRQVFVCRIPCAGAGECPLASDVCCPGQVVGQSSPTRACVPPSNCEAIDGGP